MNVFCARLPLCLGAITLLGACLAAPASADPPAVPATFSDPTAGALGSGVMGDGYTPYYFDITLDNTSVFTYTVSDTPTFNTADPTTQGYITSTDMVTFFDPNETYEPPFDVPPGEMTLTEGFELDIDGNIPGGTVLTGDLDFEGYQDDLAPSSFGGIHPQGSNVTVADPVLTFIVPATATPEPASYAAFIVAGLGLLGLGLKARRRMAR